jgi:hypothetical protein
LPPALDSARINVDGLAYGIGLVPQPECPTIVDAPSGNTTVNSGATARFEVVATGSAPFSYQWRVNGSALSDGNGIAGARGPVLSIRNTGAHNNGSYDCVVTNACGPATSSAGGLTIHCRGDFNGDGKVTVQDIFDFLAAWFAGCN